MDREQLERFRFFRRIGMFGIDPDDPESLEAMRTYVIDAFRERSRTMLCRSRSLPQYRKGGVRNTITRLQQRSQRRAQADLDAVSRRKACSEAHLARVRELPMESRSMLLPQQQRDL